MRELEQFYPKDGALEAKVADINADQTMSGEQKAQELEKLLKEAERRSETKID